MPEEKANAHEFQFREVQLKVLLRVNLVNIHQGFNSVRYN